MTRTSSRPQAVAVLEVGRTTVRLVAVAPDSRLLSSRSAPNEVRTGEPYPSCDTEHIWRWLRAALADLGERFTIAAIVPTGYGATAAMINAAEMVLPILDYEADPPATIGAAYAEVAPWFEECCCPIAPAGRTLARQLFWQARAFAEEFARARWILPFAQYWAWGLSGVPASEVTSLGAQTQLWNPRTRDFSELARRQGWVEKFPPLRNAWDVLGPLQFEIARSCALPHDIPVLCGIHDGGASFARYLAAGLDDFTLISTGASLTAFQPGLPLDRLDPLSDTMSSSDPLGRPVACARFMGSRDYAAIAGAEPAAGDPDQATVEALIAAATMALPSFGRDGGPFPGTGGQGRIVGPMPQTPRARAALASLYVALMADAALDLLGSRQRIVIDGRFLRNRLFLGLLAALRPEQAVLASPERAGTAIGAALLWGWAEREGPAPLALNAVEPLELPGLQAYAGRWRAAASSRRTSPE